jgi:hypothetical protein
MGRRLRQQWRTRSIDWFDDLNPFLLPIQLVLLPYPIPLLILYLNLLFWYSFLPLFVFYSFNYTVKSGGVCNRLLVHRQKTTLTRLYIDSLTDSVTDSVTDSINYPFVTYTFHIYIPPDFHRFTIKLLIQFSHTAKLTLCYKSFISTSLDLILVLSV